MHLISEVILDYSLIKCYYIVTGNKEARQSAGNGGNESFEAPDHDTVSDGAATMKKKNERTDHNEHF